MLTLPIKKKWYDMILSGEKKEEYRDITPYYNQRLARYSENEIVTIKLRNGYSKDSRAMLCNVKIRLARGLELWGAERDVMYYVLQIIDKMEMR